MEKEIKATSKARLLQKYPMKGYVKGWYFRQLEISACVWRIEGIDLYGRKVSRTGTDPDLLLEQCIEDAKSIIKQL